MIFNSFAKLNLYLEVRNKRKDNYHNIKTIFERIDLCDKIILRLRAKDKKIRIICSLPDVPKDNKNLTHRSAKLLQDSLHIKKGVEIKIIKRIPVGSGLGGGSSNAASVILGLNKLWKLNLSQNELIKYARKIGCDVPFFIYNTAFAQGSSCGDRIKPLTELKSVKLWHILIVPKINVSTPFIYKKWDAERSKSGSISSALTRPRYDVKILNLALRKFNLYLIGKALFNSLEQITTNLYPEVRRIKERLCALGVKSILMSGSGPAVFGIVSSRKEAVSLCRQLKAGFRSWQVFVTQTC